MENETFYCSFVSTQFIICECGETFPSEDCLKEHLEKDHAIEKPIQLEKKEQPKVHAVPKPKTKPEKLMLHYGASGKKPVYIVKKNDENKTLVVKLEDVESSLEEHLDRHHAEEIKKEVIFEYEDNYVEEPDNEVDYAVDQHHAKGLDDQVVYELSPDDIQDGPHYVVSVDAEGSEPSDCEAPGEDSMETILEGSFNDEHCYDTKLVKVEEFYCEVCGKGFASEKSVAAHVQRIHIKPYNKKNMYKKETTIGKFKQNKNIVCEVCGKKYASNAALRYHQRVHTGEKPYHCTECPKSFAMPLFLQMHYRMHTGERPYKCSLCPKAFARKAALNRHDKVHTGEKPYACQRCGKTFSQSNNVKMHELTVHLKMPCPYKSSRRRRMKDPDL